MRLVMVNMLVSSPSLLVSPSARKHRSAPSSPWSAQEVEDDRWGQGVSDRGFQNGIFLFSEMNE